MSDLRDNSITNILFLTTIDTLRSSLMQSLSISVSIIINNLLNQLSSKVKAVSAKIVASSMVPNASSEIENQLDLATTVDLTEKHVAEAENQLGNAASSGLSTSTTANCSKILVSDNIMISKVKIVAIIIKYRCKCDPTIGLVRHISVLSSVDKTPLKAL